MDSKSKSGSPAASMAVSGVSSMQITLVVVPWVASVICDRNWRSQSTIWLPALPRYRRSDRRAGGVVDREWYGPKVHRGGVEEIEFGRLVSIKRDRVAVAAQFRGPPASFVPRWAYSVQLISTALSDVRSAMASDSRRRCAGTTHETLETASRSSEKVMIELLASLWFAGR